jgi:hypothetical protein
MHVSAYTTRTQFRIILIGDLELNNDLEGERRNCLDLESADIDHGTPAGEQTEGDAPRFGKEEENAVKGWIERNKNQKLAVLEQILKDGYASQ